MRTKDIAYFSEVHPARVREGHIAFGLMGLFGGTQEGPATQPPRNDDYRLKIVAGNEVIIIEYRRVPGFHSLVPVVARNPMGHVPTMTVPTFRDWLTLGVDETDRGHVIGAFFGMSDMELESRPVYTEDPSARVRLDIVSAKQTIQFTNGETGSFSIEFPVWTRL